MKKYFITVLSFCALLIYTARVYANAGALILREEKEYSVWTNAEIFEDKKGSITDNDILKPSFQSKFSPWTFSVPNFGYTNSVYWIRFEIQNESGHIKKWGLEFRYANFNYIDFYQIETDSGKIVKTLKTGNMRPVSTRDYFHQKFIFSMDLQPGKNYTIYLRIKNIPSISLPISINSFSKIEKSALRSNILIGIILGILLLLIISNTNVIFSLKDKTYLYFSLFLVSILMFNLTYSGLAYLYLWPDCSVWNLYANPVFVSLTVIFFIVFTRKFLQVDEEKSFWSKVTDIFAKIWIFILLLIPLQLFSYQILMKIILSFLVLSIASTLFLGYKSYLNGYHPAKLFLVSMILIILTAANLALIRLALLPTWDFGENGYMAGIVFLSWLMSRALTDRIKILQSEKENAGVKLIKTDEKYRNIFNNIMDIYFEIDLAGNIVEISPSAYNLFKIEREKIINKNLSDLYTDLKETNKFISFVITKGYIKNYELGLKDIDDIQHYVSINASLIRDEQGKPLKIAGVIRDETENRKLQEQLFQSQKMESMGRLAAGIAHDFNNLLTVIKGYSELALTKLNPSEKAYKDIITIQSAGEKAGNLTRQILAFSRKQAFEPKIIDINDTITNLDKMIRRIIGEDIDFHISLTPDLPKIKADAGQIEQILFNILVNAKDALNAKTTIASEKKITIETGKSKLKETAAGFSNLSENKQYIFFAVSDNGIGIPEAIKQNIFDPFFTTKDKGKGTGLGLATVYGIVTQNKGKIMVYSEKDKGSVFKIYWLAAIGKNNNTNSEISSETTLTGTESILLVEDDESVKNFAYLALKNFGYQVSAASNGLEALDIIGKNDKSFDLVITDLVMPEMGGSELSAQLKKTAPDLKILFVSGYSDDHIVHSGKLDKDIDFLHKPYSINDLAAKVREILDRT